MSLPESDPLLSPDSEHSVPMVNPEFRKGDSTAQWLLFSSTAAFLTLTWAIIFNSGVEGPFFFHPLLQSFGISAFAYGITTLQPTALPTSKAKGLTRHQRAMILGALSLVAGSSSMFYAKALHSAPHLTTWHSVFGVLSLIWMFVQMMFGAASVWFDGILLGGKDKAKAFWKFHRLSGYVLFPSLLFTAHLGGSWSDWVVANSSHAVRLAAFTAAPLLLLATMYSRIRTSKMKLF